MFARYFLQIYKRFDLSTIDGDRTVKCSAYNFFPFIFCHRNYICNLF